MLSHALAAFMFLTTPNADPNNACLGQLAQDTFAQAICTCGMYAGSASLEVQANPSSSQAPVEFDGIMTATGPVSLSGSLTLAATKSNRVVGPLSVGGTLASTSALFCNADLSVDGNALFGGKTSVWGRLRVGGSTLLAPSASLYVGTGSAPQTTVARLNVTPACPCAPREQVDVAGRVHDHVQSNDNGSIGLNRAALENVQSPITLTLPSGNYYLTGITANAPVTIEAQGAVALYIDGDINTGDTLSIVGDPNNGLDVFVAGGVEVSGPFYFGRVSAPQQARLYVAASYFYTSGGLNLAGNLYAPHANLAISSNTHVLGAIFVYNLYQSAPLRLTYDTAVNSVGNSCNPNTPTTDPNVPTSNPNTPTTDPNAPTGNPNTPTTDPNAPTSNPNTPTTDPNAIVCAVCGDCESTVTCTVAGVCGACDDNNPCCAGSKCNDGVCQSVSY